MAAAAPTTRGIRLFRFLGIDVYLHWLWFLVAFYEVYQRMGSYSSIAWNIAEYLALFLIVLLHEFGHALACRSVGGEANRILLWPFGGVAYVKAPPRPGALLWSIAAGPLVNVLLAPVTIGLYYLAARGYMPASHDVLHFLLTVAIINVILFCFNMLPIYPLDGGQILQSLLWFVVGRYWSLIIAGCIGLLGAAGAAAWALTRQDWWIAILAALGASRCWNALKYARVLRAMAGLPRRQNVACPRCHASPPAVPVWRCSCGTNFDTFVTHATCPTCGQTAEETVCVDCGARTPFAQWLGVENLPPRPLPVHLTGAWQPNPPFAAVATAPLASPPPSPQ